MSFTIVDGRFADPKPRLLLIGSTGKIGERVLQELIGSNSFQISILFLLVIKG